MRRIAVPVSTLRCECCQDRAVSAVRVMSHSPCYEIAFAAGEGHKDPTVVDGLSEFDIPARGSQVELYLPEETHLAFDCVGWKDEHGVLHRCTRAR